MGHNADVADARPMLGGHRWGYSSSLWFIFSFFLFLFRGGGSPEERHTHISGTLPSGFERRQRCHKDARKKTEKHSDVRSGKNSSSVDFPRIRATV